MSNDKLQRGVTLLAQANTDRDLLGVALLALHAAMEAALLDALESSDTLGANDRQAIARDAVDMRALVALAERHIGLSRIEGNAILEAEGQRNRFAGGEPFSGTAERLLRYARLVEAFYGEDGLLDTTLIAARKQHVANATRPLSTAASARSSGWLSGWAIAQIVGLFVIVGVLGVGGWWLYRQLDVWRLVGALGTPPTAVARPTLIVPEQTAQRHARVVRIGEGPGWLHATPDFASATLPVPLHDGIIVSLLDQQTTGTDGTIWLHVSANGYEGWCPAQNLELAS